MESISTQDNNKIYKEKSRDLSLDAIAGFFILLMMFRHFGILTKHPYTFGHIFMFNICWFFFKSGMFHRPVKLTGQILLRWAKRLIVPLAVSFAVILLINAIGSIVHHKSFISLMYPEIRSLLLYGNTIWNFPTWFLLTMFIVKIVTSNYKGSNLSTWVYILISLIIASLHHFFSLYQFSYIGNTALGVIFYILGAKTAKMNIFTVTYASLLFLYGIIFIFFPAVIDVSSNETLHGDYFLAIIAAAAGVFLINKLFRLIKFLQISPFIFMGQNAMIFLLFHQPLFNLATRFFYHFWRTLPELSQIPEEVMKWVAGIATISTCFIICIIFDRFKKLRWIIGG